MSEGEESLRSLEERGAFSHAVITAGPVQDDAVELYDRWLDRGDSGTIDYMSRWRDVRNDPRLLIPAEEGGPARSLIICLFAYPHHAVLGEPDGIAAYAHANTEAYTYPFAHTGTNAGAYGHALPGVDVRAHARLHPLHDPGPHPGAHTNTHSGA